ncbi:uncharacterized protein N7525_001168 [Penicillium rubens]|uniref:uncharacterized protein n=1 Tax=Penicillium rubens TaxID=1108849 RepID=UPI002A59CB44|nr:uncharacterized protein N7525_001168 [Penicillium rubens]KAJ5843427.1 hypothetical protein N7525_001168 [Penicillium rubens]
MSSTIKPIQLYGGLLGPNPLKVGIILTLLEVPFESVPVAFAKVKEPEYEAINPNGRLPSIHDPNTNLTIWESGAIVEYLIERYDTKEPRKLSFTPGSAEAELARSFLHLQVSGQGPYYGQAYWFKMYHAEKITTAVKRYVDEAKRVTGVLDKWLGKQKEANDKNAGDGPWLRSFRGKRGAHASFEDEGFNVDEFPNEKEWFERMISKEPIKAVLASADEQMASMKH